MEMYFVRIDPVQEVAAEPGTLDTLIDILRPKAVEPRASEEFLAMARGSNWPLVYDEKIPPGYVHCRPTPGAPPPRTDAQIGDYLRALMPSATPHSVLDEPQEPTP